MTYPTDAQIAAATAAAHHASLHVVIANHAMCAAILAADRAAWVSDGSVPDHCEEVLICAADGFYITGRFDTQCDMFNTGCGWMRKSEVIAWRKIIGPETLP